ncbi:MAG TPA: ATP-dependent Clp protease proteolytic subunit, partial [Propionibacteriaceae bacterium]
MKTVPNMTTSMDMPMLPGGLAPAGPRADYYIPQWEERTSYGVRRVDPYTKLFEDRIIFLGT